MNKDAIKLAFEFSKLIQAWLTPEQIESVNKINKTSGYLNGECCASHEFCDANQAMIDAYEFVFKKDLDINEYKFINVAWELAKTNDFDSNILQKLLN